jgi:hypothetical protein
MLSQSLNSKLNSGFDSRLFFVSDFLFWNSGLVFPLVIYGSFCDLNESMVRFVSV